MRNKHIDIEFFTNITAFLELRARKRISPILADAGHEGEKDAHRRSCWKASKRDGKGGNCSSLKSKGSRQALRAA